MANLPPSLSPPSKHSNSFSHHIHPPGTCSFTPAPVSLINSCSSFLSPSSVIPHCLLPWLSLLSVSAGSLSPSFEIGPLPPAPVENQATKHNKSGQESTLQTVKLILVFGPTDRLLRILFSVPSAPGPFCFHGPLESALHTHRKNAIGRGMKYACDLRISFAPNSLVRFGVGAGVLSSLLKPPGVPGDYFTYQEILGAPPPIKEADVSSPRQLPVCYLLELSSELHLNLSPIIFN